MIIGLTGYARSGKDTVAKSLRLRGGFRRIAFADKLKDLALRLDPIVGVESLSGDLFFTRVQELVDSQGWEDAKKQHDVRHLLQRLGNEAREVLGDNVWVEAVRGQLLTYISENKNVVFTDVRYENEAQLVHAYGGKMVRVVRPNVQALNNHVTETNVDLISVDDTIMNDGTINDLGAKVTELLRKYGA